VPRFTEVITKAKVYEVKLRAMKELKNPDLNCDSCGYRYKSNPSRCVESYVGEKCPVCGVIMVTEKDFENYLSMQTSIKILNFLLLPYMIYLNLFNRKKLVEQYGEYSTKTGIRINDQ
jgi:hypothetical protein